MKKNIPIMVGIIAVVLVAAGLWYSFFSNSAQKKTGTINTSSVNSASASDHFKVTPLTKEFVVDENAAANYGNQKVTIDSPEALPVSTSFKNFSYDQTKGETIKISGTCSDEYYAIVVFQNIVDYKKDPAASVINQAFPCPEDGKFTKGFELKDFNLVSGEYYFFVADQGKTGSWYNPR